MVVNESAGRGLRRFQVLIQWDEADEVWVTHVPSLGYISTYGDSREEALSQTRDAILGYLEAAAKEKSPITAPNGEVELVELEVAAP